MTDLNLATNGLALLLLFPWTVTLLVVARYLIGLRGLGILTPLLIAIAWLWVGWLPGLLLFIFILALGIFVRLLIKGWQIHYLARLSLIIWLVCLVIIIGWSTWKLPATPLVLLILGMENYIEVQIKQSWRTAVSLGLETLVVSLGCYGLLSWSFLQQLALQQPLLVLASALIVNLLVGRYTGMRLWEYRRFSRLLK